jgi:general secretion pathway protein B
MSYILDALKKSEEERHQGQVPILGGASTLIHSSGNKSIVWPWAITALLLLNMLVVVYWLMSGDTSDMSSVNIVEDSHQENSVRAEPRITSDAPIYAPIDEPAYEPPTLYEPPKPHETPVLPKAVPPKTAPYKVAVATVVPSEPKAELQSEFEAEEPLLITPKGGARPYNGPAYNGPVYDEVGEDIAIEEPDFSSVRHASDFPSSFQRRIPDMSFNSHIFTSKPDSRRVMINNIYLSEGQVFSGLTVVQITEGGVVLSLDGQAFKVGVLRDWNSPR